MGKTDKELIEEINELNKTSDKIKLTTDVLEWKLFNKRNPIVIEKYEKTKTKKQKIYSILSKIFRVLMFNVFIPGIVVFYVTNKMEEVFNPSAQPIVYSISDLSNKPKILTQEAKISSEFINNYAFCGNLNFNINVSKGVLDKTFIVFSKDDSNDIKLEDFHLMNAKKKSSGIPLIRSGNLKVDSNIQFYSKSNLKMKNFYVVMLDKSGNYNIDLLLINMESNFVLFSDPIGGTNFRPNPDNVITSREYKKKLILGTNILGQETDFDEPLLRFKGDDTFSNKYDKRQYFKDKKIIEQYIAKTPV